MSTPSEFWVAYQDGSFVEVLMDKRACADLFSYMVPRMYDVAPDYAEEFEYSNWETLAIDSAPEKYYAAICDLVLEAADKFESVSPYKADLQAALEADPRFKH